MPRKYVKKRDGDLPKYDVLVQAIKEVKIENKPRNYVARCYKIPKTNLYRYIELLEEEEVDFSKDDVLIDFVKISELKTQADKRTLIKSKKKTSTKSAPAKKQRRDSSSSTSSEEEFCTICLKQMPKKLNRNNSVNCNVCKRPVHLKCANVTASYYTCVHCDSDYSDNE